MNTDTLSLIIKYMSRALMLFLLMPVLNYVKGSIAKKMGDDTAEMAGRITLDPMAHLDLLGSLMIMLIGFGWSKPLPINYNRMKNSRTGAIVIAITGPITLFIMAILCKNISTILSYLLTGMTGFSVSLIFMLLGSLATCIGVIHLLPLPGMDGFTLIYHLAGNKFVSWYHRNQRTIDQVSFYILLFLFFVGDLTRGAFDPLGWIISFFNFIFELTTLWVPFVFG